jgi:osmotically-inducible protein OsmY
MASEWTAEDQPVEYLIEHVRGALAQDPRLNELHLQVSITGRKIIVCGEVDTEERRGAVTEVVQDILPDYEVSNQATVASIPDAPKVEQL